jgi:hypothetical protein
MQSGRFPAVELRFHVEYNTAAAPEEPRKQRPSALPILRVGHRDNHRMRRMQSVHRCELDSVLLLDRAGIRQRIVHWRARSNEYARKLIFAKQPQTK